MAFASVGGFLESYSYITRNGVFANAQTGNIARLGMSLAQGDFKMVLRYLVPIIIFVFGVTLSMHLKKMLTGAKHFPISFAQVAVTIEMLLLFITGLIPVGKYDILATALVSFVCSIQVESFRYFSDNPFASTMCTGNLRSATEKLFAYISTGKRELLQTSMRYYSIDAVFAMSVALGYCSTVRFACRSVWLCLLVLGALLVLFTFDNKTSASAEQ